jgi:phosphatidylglycerophosphate synthase
MKFLLPHRFKVIGAIIAPAGFFLWLAMQFGYISKILVNTLDEPTTTSSHQVINVMIAIISFFSFLSGIYFVTFSKEKIEDEMVQRTRLESFQFAAIIQIVFMIAGFLVMLFAGDPGESGMMLFFIVLVFLFWITFIGRFNYMLHVKLKP